MGKSDGIRQKKHLQGVVSFDGMTRHRNIRPTDIDGVIDYRGNAFLFFELKYHLRPSVPLGQRIALQNIAKAMNVPTLVVVATHANEVDVGTIIDAKSCQVKEYFVKGRWERPKTPTTLLRIIELFEQYLTKEGISI